MNKVVFSRSKDIFDGWSPASVLEDLGGFASMNIWIVGLGDGDSLRFCGYL